METRLIVCGGVDFTDYAMLSRELDALIAALGTVTLVSGGARGADALAGRYAAERGNPIRVFPAEWKRYGKAAGPIRNRAMLRFAGEAQAQAAAFWNGKSRGTANMIALAEQAGILCRIWLYRKDACEKA